MCALNTSSDQAAEAELLRISNRVRFIKGVIAGTLRVNNRKKLDVEADLQAQHFDRLPSKAKVGRALLTHVIMLLCLCLTYAKTHKQIARHQPVSASSAYLQFQKLLESSACSFVLCTQ